MGGAGPSRSPRYFGQDEGARQSARLAVAGVSPVVPDGEGPPVWAGLLQCGSGGMGPSGTGWGGPVDPRCPGAYLFWP